MFWIWVALVELAVETRVRVLISFIWTHKDRGLVSIAAIHYANIDELQVWGQEYGGDVVLILDDNNRRGLYHDEYKLMTTDRNTLSSIAIWQSSIIVSEAENLSSWTAKVIIVTV